MVAGWPLPMSTIRRSVAARRGISGGSSWSARAAACSVVSGEMRMTAQREMSGFILRSSVGVSGGRAAKAQISVALISVRMDLRAATLA